MSAIDLKYEGLRLRDRKAEGGLLVSIQEKGILEPLSGVNRGERVILLDGFKRYRCAQSLNIGVVPMLLGEEDEVSGLLSMLRKSTENPLSIIEQACLIEELKSVNGLEGKEIAERLEKSPAWVSMRSDLMAGMSAYVKNQVFAGRFPVYAYMYTLRRFIRMNRVKISEVDEFVGLAVKHRMSIRQIETNAQRFFMGDDRVKGQMNKGSLQKRPGPVGLCAYEQDLLVILERLWTDLLGFCGYAQSGYSGIFLSQANLIAANIMGHLPEFSLKMERFHDQSGKEKCDLSVVQRGDDDPQDRADLEGQSESGPQNHRTERSDAGPEKK